MEEDARNEVRYEEEERKAIESIANARAASGGSFRGTLQNQGGRSQFVDLSSWTVEEEGYRWSTIVGLDRWVVWKEGSKYYLQT